MILMTIVKQKEVFKITKIDSIYIQKEVFQITKIN